MKRKLASIVTISELLPIENADRLEVAKMVGKEWKVVVQKGEFHIGQLAVYFEIDSALPADDSRYEFLKERCLRKFVSKSGNVLKEVIRIKTIKLRGVVSQGLLLPLNNYPELHDSSDGDDVTEYLKVEHFDELKEMLAPVTTSLGNNQSAGSFPSYIPKTDEERLQNLGKYFTIMKGRTFEITSKDDGSSMTVFYSPTIDQEDPFGVCSRNFRLKRPDPEKEMTSKFWFAVFKYKLEEQLKMFFEKTECEFAFQGELIGPGIQNNRDLYPECEWHVFRIWDIKNQRYLDPKNRRLLCQTLHFEHVEVIDTNVDVFNKYHNMDEMLQLSDGKTKRGNQREGLVFKSDDEKEPFVSFKVVSNKYLLKQEA